MLLIVPGGPLKSIQFVAWSPKSSRVTGWSNARLAVTSERLCSLSISKATRRNEPPGSIGNLPLPTSALL